MADPPVRKPPSSEREHFGGAQPASRIPPAQEEESVLPDPQMESDLSHLTDLFAAHGGGQFSQQFSANLALEIVLNETVEQICLTTGATGAAIVLVNGEEIVCRARSGTTVPPLGSRLAGASGLSGECLRTRQAQRCDDVLMDERADTEASQSLGVRSVLIVPLLDTAIEGGKILGMVEIFSSRPGAFGKRDENTLEAFAGRIREDLKRARGPSLETAKNEEGEKVKAKPDMDSGTIDGSEVAEAADHHEQAEAIFFGTSDAPEKNSWTGFDYLTLALGTAVLGSAVFLGTLVEQRIRGAHSRVNAESEVRPLRGGDPKPKQGASESGVAAVGNSPATLPDPNKLAKNVGGSASSPGTDAAQTPNAQTSKRKRASEGPGTGGLSVYENGKEIFHLPGGAGEGRGKGEVEPASSLERDRTVRLSPSEAEGFLVYRTEPEYPEEARVQGVQGAVVLEVWIGKTGAVEDVKLISGSPLLALSAIAAVKQWRFEPRFANGQAMEMRTTVTLDFKLPS